MAVSPYFQHIDASNEQDLFHSLAEEFIQLAGVNCYYIKVEQVDDDNYDKLFGENRFEVLQNATLIEMYLKDMEQPLGNDDLYAKFGLSQPHSCTFLVGVRRFNSEFGHRPREGDYVYLPNWSIGPDDIFRIAKVEVTDYQFKALGSPVYYFLRCERAKFNHQIVNTGIADLDNSATINNNSVENDRNADNDPLQELSDMFINFDEKHPFGKP